MNTTVVSNTGFALPCWSVMVKKHFDGNEGNAIDFLIEHGPIDLIRLIYPEIKSDANYIYPDGKFFYTPKELAEQLAPQLSDLYLVASTHYIVRSKKDPTNCVTGVIKLQNSAVQFNEAKYTKNLPHILSKSFRTNAG